jgi:hypothetical protein
MAKTAGAWLQPPQQCLKKFVLQAYSPEGNPGI